MGGLKERSLLDWHRRSLIAASLLVVAMGALGAVFVPLALERVEMGGADAPRGMPWARAEQHQSPARAEKQSALPRVTERPLPVPEERSPPPLTLEQHVKTPENDGELKSAFAQQPESVSREPSASAPAAAVPQEVQPAKPETRPSAPNTTERMVRTPRRASARPERHVAKPKQASDTNAEKRAREARRAVRRFDDNLRDVPVSAYASDGRPRTIVIHPTSIQDYYYYSTRR
jgi:hypothetical protein